MLPFSKKFTDSKSKLERALVALLYALPVFFLVNVFIQEAWEEGNLGGYFDLDHHSNVPYYLSFFLTTISVYYLYKTLTNQRAANQIQAFENRFFKFIDYHRQNVNELRYRDPDTKEERFWTGNAVFTIIHYEFKRLLHEYILSSDFSKLSVPAKRKVIDFIYRCIFYGAGEEGLAVLKKEFPEELKKINFEIGWQLITPEVK